MNPKLKINLIYYNKDDRCLLIIIFIIISIFIVIRKNWSLRQGHLTKKKKPCNLHKLQYNLNLIIFLKMKYTRA